MRLYFIYLLVLVLIPRMFAQGVELNTGWQFSTVDDTMNKFHGDVSGMWKPIRVGLSWEIQGYNNYDGIGWYSCTFKIDKKLLGKELYLLAGTIDDADETYLNGIHIGSTGKFPPEYHSEWATQRVYKIPPNILQENNYLSIRVYDGGGPGGIYTGILGIYTKSGYEKVLDYTPGKKKSFFKLVTSNGLIAAVYNEKTNEIENVFPHIFQNIDEGVPVKPFVSGIKLNTPLIISKAEYFENTQILKLSYSNVKVFYFASFLENEKVFYSVIEGEKTIVNSLSFLFSKGHGEILIDSVITFAGKKSRKYYLYSFNDSLHQNTTILVEAKNRIQFNFVEQEAGYMKGIFRSLSLPKKLTRTEKDVVKQSVTVLKMSQVSQKEIYPLSRGQILASLPPGVWNICWIRDASYSVMALSDVGMFSEAKNALLFFLNARANRYKSFIHKDGIDYGIGMDYQISVCRYFGNGNEESDFNEAGPNIELDGFGLFLTAYSDYVTKSKDKEFFEATYKRVLDYVVRPLIHSIDKNGLIRKDSGHWERHLPGKQYTFTSVTAMRGLNDFYELNLAYKPENSREVGFISEAGITLSSAIKNLLVTDDGMLKGFAGAELGMHESFDAASFEFFTDPRINQQELFQTHHSLYNKNLKLSANRGYFRINGGDWYDRQEWIFLNLRIAVAYKNNGMYNKAKELINWVTEQAEMNNNLIPELFHEKTSKYEGAVPKVGFGAGSYILALNNYYGKNR